MRRPRTACWTKEGPVAAGLASRKRSRKTLPSRIFVEPPHIWAETREPLRTVVLILIDVLQSHAPEPAAPAIAQQRWTELEVETSMCAQEGRESKNWRVRDRRVCERERTPERVQGGRDSSDANALQAFLIFSRTFHEAQGAASRAGTCTAAPRLTRAGS